jgi:hypothetical protein
LGYKKTPEGVFVYLRVERNWLSEDNVGKYLRCNMLGLDNVLKKSKEDMRRYWLFMKR